MRKQPLLGPCLVLIPPTATEQHIETVLLDCVPTAENLARIAFERLDAVYRDTYGNHLQLEQVRLYETPNCWADARCATLD